MKGNIGLSRKEEYQTQTKRKKLVFFSFFNEGPKKQRKFRSGQYSEFLSRLYTYTHRGSIHRNSDYFLGVSQQPNTNKELKDNNSEVLTRI